LPYYDIHAHFAPDPMPEAIVRMLCAPERDEGFAPGQAPGEPWSVDTALAFMDERDIAMQLLSLPIAADADLARTINTAAAEVVQQFPDRFGFLATVPLSSPEDAVAEIRYARSELGADGASLLSDADGKYFGDAFFEPIWKALTEHHMTAFVHPVAPVAFSQLGLGRPAPLIEYPMDTARTVVDAIYQSVFLRHPNLRLVLAHGGGTLPALAARVLLLGTKPWVRNPHNLSRAQLLQQFQGLALESALTGGSNNLLPIPALEQPLPVLFGTDFPPAGRDAIDATTQSLKDIGIEQATLTEQFRKLFPTAWARTAR
jgi:predicted TIM-barrel fold metal-dependent hydrolase